MQSDGGILEVWSLIMIRFSPEPVQVFSAICFFSSYSALWFMRFRRYTYGLCLIPYLPHNFTLHLRCSAFQGSNPVRGLRHTNREDETENSLEGSLL